MRCLSDEARIPANPGARGEQVAVARDDLGSKRRKPDGAAGRDVAARRRASSALASSMFSASMAMSVIIATRSPVICTKPSPIARK